MDFTRDTAKQWAQETVSGLYMCPVTPMTADFSFDEKGIHENIEAFCEMGLNGLVVGGFISECWNVKLSEWMRYHEIIAEANAGRMDLWTIILDPSVHQALEKTAFVEKLGFSGAEVINPVVQLRTDDEVFNFFKYLTERTDLAVCLYRTPVSGKVLGWELMERLVDLDTVVAVKQGVMNRAETLKLRSMLRDDFIVSDPFESFFLEDLRQGGQVIYGELSYIIYGKQRHLMREYMELANAGEWQEAYAKWEQLSPVREYYNDLFIWDIAKTFTYASALANMKIWFEEIGLNAGPVLPPVEQATSQRREEIRGNLRNLGVI